MSEQVLPIYFQKQLVTEAATWIHQDEAVTLLTHITTPKTKETPGVGNETITPTLGEEEDCS